MAKACSALWTSVISYMGRGGGIIATVLSWGNILASKTNLLTNVNLNICHNADF